MPKCLFIVVSEIELQDYCNILYKLNTFHLAVT